MIAICIGHSRKIGSRYDGGAYSPWLKSNEREFNLKVADKLSCLLATRGLKSTVISHYDGRGYGSAMVDVAKRVKDAGASIAVELHFNAATPSANGHEWLYWHSSKKGQAAAKVFDEEFSKRFPIIKARGIKPIKPTDRGGSFLRYTHCPSLILEPFFGSNDGDCWSISVDGIAQSYCDALFRCSKL